MDRIVGRPISQNELELIYRECDPSEVEPEMLCPFLDSGPYAVAKEESFREIDEFTVPCILDDDLERHVAEILKAHNPAERVIDGYTGPRPPPLRQRAEARSLVVPPLDLRREDVGLRPPDRVRRTQAHADQRRRAIHEHRRLQTEESHAPSSTSTSFPRPSTARAWPDLILQIDAMGPDGYRRADKLIPDIQETHGEHRRRLPSASRLDARRLRRA